ncbi:hypothetical protein H4582DRAFT_2061379 [Lactarius indigo]|nr:hypothetical protein H4582DRAFT_2061379 [Lactarius indigo]
MTTGKHSKNNAAPSIFSYAERKKLDHGMRGKKDIERQKERLDALKKVAEQERANAKDAARGRVLAEFEKEQLGLAAVALVTTSGTDAPVRTTCRGGNPPHPIALKNSIAVNSTWQPQFSRSQPTDPTLVNGGSPGQKDEDRDAMCLSCKEELSNSVRIYGGPSSTAVACCVANGYSGNGLDRNPGGRALGYWV